MEYSAYIARMMGNADRKAQLDFADKRGVEKGIAKVAKNMLAKKFSIADIIKATDLSREQVRALKMS